MMRWLVTWFLLGTVAWAQTETSPVPAAVPVAGPGQEWIVVSGGPALRYYEKSKVASHDKYWGNFIDSALISLRSIKAKAAAGDIVTWMVYRPSYADRGIEEQADLLPIIHQKAQQAGVSLLWFDNANQLINYLNHGQNRVQTPIIHFEYFGHSNKACFLFDYSNTLDAMSVNFLHVRDLKRIDRTDFAAGAVCKSWGCHSGEFYSERWFTYVGVPLEGAIGKTDYSQGGMPVLSNAQGSWFRYTGTETVPTEAPVETVRN